MVLLEKKLMVHNGILKETIGISVTVYIGFYFSRAVPYEN